jgi:hypothetical protein
VQVPNPLVPSGLFAMFIVKFDRAGMALMDLEASRLSPLPTEGRRSGLTQPGPPPMACAVCARCARWKQRGGLQATLSLERTGERPKRTQ